VGTLWSANTAATCSRRIPSVSGTLLHIQSPPTAANTVYKKKVGASPKLSNIERNVIDTPYANSQFTVTACRRQKARRTSW
jgi:hypothetical protein